MFRLCSPRERKEFSMLCERFGIAKECFAGFELYSGDKGRIFLGPRQVHAKNFQSLGIQAARLGRRPKPAVAFLRAFSAAITKSRISLTREEARRYMKGENMLMEKVSLEDGHVALFYNEYCLGCGLLRKGTIKNMLPGAKRADILML